MLFLGRGGQGSRRVPDSMFVRISNTRVVWQRTHSITRQRNTTLHPRIQRQQIMQRPLLRLLDQLSHIISPHVALDSTSGTHREQIRHHPIPPLVVLLHLTQRARRDPRAMERTFRLWFGAVRDESDHVQCGSAVDGEREDVLRAARGVSVLCREWTGGGERTFWSPSHILGRRTSSPHMATALSIGRRPR